MKISVSRSDLISTRRAQVRGSPVIGTKADRRAARERVSAYHQAQLARLLSHVAAAIDRDRAGEIDACTVDETIHHYHLAATQLSGSSASPVAEAPTPSSSPASSTA